MTLDLWDVRRRVSQRNERVNSSSSKEMMEAFRVLLKSPNVENAIIFYKAEAHFLEYHPRNRNIYGPIVLDAIKNKKFVIERPQLHKRGLSTENPERGYVYYATSEQRLRQGKIGYTAKMTPEQRCQKFKSRYSYYDFKCKAWAYVDNPLSFEDYVQSMIREDLVSGCVYRDSTEWYRCSRKKFVETVLAVSANHDLCIYSTSWNK